MKLPPYRKAVRIKFWSLRNGIGSNMGVIFDIDTQVERECYRVKDGDGWRWIIKGHNRLPLWDLVWADTDQECLDNMGSELDFEIVNLF
jgi:hypothetical protein